MSWYVEALGWARRQIMGKEVDALEAGAAAADGPAIGQDRR